MGSDPDPSATNAGTYFRATNACTYLRATNTSTRTYACTTTHPEGGADKHETRASCSAYCCPHIDSGAADQHAGAGANTSATCTYYSAYCHTRTTNATTTDQHTGSNQHACAADCNAFGVSFPCLSDGDPGGGQSRELTILSLPTLTVERSHIGVSRRAQRIHTGLTATATGSAARGFD